MECCHAKSADAAKATCCAGKEAKDMAFCGQKDAAGKTAANCCEGKKDTMCVVKDGKACCGGMTDHCAVHTNGN